jgi:hypothetical protein
MHLASASAWHAAHQFVRTPLVLHAVFIVVAKFLMLLQPYRFEEALRIAIHIQAK